MKLTQLLLDQLDREAVRTRRALEHVPSGKDDWTPHPKSMPLLRLAGLVATMPSWIALVINKDELELSPPQGQGQFQQPTFEGLVSTLDKAVQDGRAALAGTTDDYLLTTNWKLLFKGNVVMNQPRHVVLADTFSHTRAPSRPTDRVCAPQRDAGARDLRAVGRRPALRLKQFSD
jgi:hypothetical protein